LLLLLLKEEETGQTDACNFEIRFTVPQWQIHQQEQYGRQKLVQSAGVLDEHTGDSCSWRKSCMGITRIRSAPLIIYTGVIKSQSSVSQKQTKEYACAHIMEEA
jgi:hypothetical protein